MWWSKFSSDIGYIRAPHSKIGLPSSLLFRTNPLIFKIRNKELQFLELVSSKCQGDTFGWLWEWFMNEVRWIANTKTSVLFWSQIMKHLFIMKFSLDMGVWESGFTYCSLVPVGKGSSWQCLIRPNSGEAKILLKKKKKQKQIGMSQVRSAPLNLLHHFLSSFPPFLNDPRSLKCN